MYTGKPKLVAAHRPLCPMCGKSSYSLGGVHPQCLAHQADSVMAAAQRAARKLSGELKK